MLSLQGVLFAAVYHQLAEQELQHEVGEHGDDEDHKVVDTVGLRHVTQECGQGREGQVKTKDLRHGNRHIGGGLEGIAAIQRKVPQNGQHSEVR